MNQQQEDLKAIREMMEKSSKFLSLSGLSGVMAGLTAICGAAFAYFYLLRDPSLTDYNRTQEILILLADAALVFVGAIGFGIYFSWRKAKKNNQKLFNKVVYRVLYQLSIPLFAGGVLCLIFIWHGYYELVAPLTLIFYGLALVNASKFTFEEIHYLGVTEIILGVLSAVFLAHGIFFWTIGFGFCHVIYGLVLYKKYDRT